MDDEPETPEERKERLAKEKEQNKRYWIKQFTDSELKKELHNRNLEHLKEQERLCREKAQKISDAIDFLRKEGYEIK